MSKLQVIAGPYQLAKRYAQAHRLHPDEYVIVTRGHQLARLDPAMITKVITVQLHTMGARITGEIHDELARLKALWPVPLLAAA